MLPHSDFFFVLSSRFATSFRRRTPSLLASISGSARLGFPRACAVRVSGTPRSRLEAGRVTFSGRELHQCRRGQRSAVEETVRWFRDDEHAWSRAPALVAALSRVDVKLRLDSRRAQPPHHYRRIKPQPHTPYRCSHHARSDRTRISRCPSPKSQASKPTEASPNSSAPKLPSF